MNRRLALVAFLFSKSGLATERKDKTRGKKFKVMMQRKQGVSTHGAPQASIPVYVEAFNSEAAKRLAESQYHDYRALNAIPQ